VTQPADLGLRAWTGLALLLALGAIVGAALSPGTATLDWQPAHAFDEPWRWWSAAFVHFSVLHLVGNLLGVALLAALDSTAQLPWRAALACFQSNAESELIDRIHGAAGAGIGCLIFNPGAFTHTSIALRDALLAVRLPFVEVHLSNTQAREPFRHHSYFSDIAAGVITGLGAFGYELAVRAAVRQLKKPV